MKYLRLIPLLAILTLAVVPAATAQVASVPNYRISNTLSLNWSGYAVNITGVTSVSGTFTVPTVSGPSSVGGSPTDVSVWVGIDGYSTGTVEQTGISGSYGASGATYYAWWEMYPRVSMTIHSMTISAGDSITASVAYNGGGSFTLSIADNTNGQAFSTTVSAPVNGPDAAQRGSAEWIVERAATISNGYLTILPLATFDSTTFTHASFATTAGSSSLQDAIAVYPACGPSPSFAPCYDQITMVSVNSDGSLTNLVSVTTASSNSFTVSWLANGTPFPIPGVYRH
ncbi:MAG: hypothetical protein JRN21_03480 [Nitrososphaerota archaeon]|nr:hypothetical protein [Nitrososphaerota archaeon]